MIDPLSLAAGYVAEKSVDGIVREASKRKKRNAPLSFEEIEIGKKLPYRIGLMGKITDKDLTNDSESTIRSKHPYYDYNGKKCRMGYCDVKLRIKNIAKEKVSIRGLGIDKTVVNPMPESSFLVISQGGGPLSKCYRFAINLDFDKPTIQRFELVNGEQNLIGDIHFFDDSSIELDADEIVNLELILIARKKSYQIDLYFRYEIAGKVNVIDVPLEEMPVICPASIIPNNQRFRATFSWELPQMALENSPCFSSCTHWLFD